MSSKEDLDAFLTSLESKLRGPFSGLEIAKAVASANDPVQYLSNIQHILHRAEKVTQLRILVGLLGLNTNCDTSIKDILQTAREAPRFEEWVRVVSGLVQNIQTDHLTEEAQTILDKTIAEILQKVKDTIEQTSVIDEETEYRLGQANVDPTLVPFRYSLLPPPLLQTVLPETIQPHDHFQVNESAEILHLDQRLEVQRAKEEHEHAQSVAVRKPAAKPTARQPDFPGFRPTNKSKPTTSQQRPKSSMFMPSKRPATTAATGATKQAGGALKSLKKKGLQPVQKTLLSKRKPGAAQALLAKGRRRAGLSSSSRAANSSKPKMMTLGLEEVTQLTQQQQQQQQQTKDTAEPGKRGRPKKRKQPPDHSATTKPPPAKKPPPPTFETTIVPAKHNNNKTVAVHPGALALDALTTYQQQQQQQQQQQTEPSHTGDSKPPATPDSNNNNNHWRDIIEQKSNKLTADDRLRIEQFFLHHHNPTPDLPTYKVKLHEIRHPNSKETYYLELDYHTHKAKQSKKTKRYK